MKKFIYESPFNPPFHGHHEDTMIEHGHVPPFNPELVPLLNSEIYDIVEYVFEL